MPSQVWMRSVVVILVPWCEDGILGQVLIHTVQTYHSSCGLGRPVCFCRNKKDEMNLGGRCPFSPTHHLDLERLNHMHLSLVSLYDAISRFYILRVGNLSHRQCGRGQCEASPWKLSRLLSVTLGLNKALYLVGPRQPFFSFLNITCKAFSEGLFAIFFSPLHFF